MLTTLLADIAAAGRGRLWRSIAKLTIAMSLLALGVTAALGGLIFVFLGLYFSLVEIIPSWQAGAIVGGAVMLVAIIVLWIVTWIIARQSLTARSPVSPDGPAIKLGAAVSETIAKSNIKTTDIVLIALLAGLVLGASPHLQQRIFGRKKEKQKTPPAKD